MTAAFSASKAKGRVNIPSSKALAHRLIICAALSEEESTLRNVAFSSDVLATIDCIKTLGAQCSIDGSTLKIRGVDFCGRKKPVTIDCGGSYSTFGFLAPLLMVSDKKAVIEGDRSIFDRSFDEQEKLCKAHKVKFKATSEKASVKGDLTPGDYTILGSDSSHFISGLIYALTLLPGNSRIFITPPIDGRNYIDTTVKVLAGVGAGVKWSGQSMVTIEGNHRYGAIDTEIEGDWSVAAYFDIFNCIGGDITLEGLNEETIQGDKIYPEFFRQMREDESPEINISEHPDIAPALFVYAALNRGATFRGLARLKPKEKRCIEQLSKELSKLNVFLALGDDTAIINRSLVKPSPTPLKSNGDHRAVMALAALLSITGGEIEDAEIINKTIPQYFDALAQAGIEAER